MMGDHNKAETTAEVFRNCWYHSGDGGYFDEKGNFYFTDRIKDYIRRRGENISSMEVENVIMSHPAVKEAGAVGVQEYEGLEEELLAYVVLTEGQSVDPVEIIQWCEERMPYYAVPRYIEFAAELSKTPSEKVQTPVREATEEEIEETIKNHILAAIRVKRAVKVFSVLRMRKRKPRKQVSRFS